MASPFDKTFESNKLDFENKFSKKWNEDPSLYLAYVQTIYIATLAEIANKGFAASSAQQEEIKTLIQAVNKKLGDK